MTDAQKILFTNEEMKKTFGGWMPTFAKDYDSILKALNENSVNQEDVEETTHYLFSDGSKVVERMNEKQEKVFNHYTD